MSLTPIAYRTATRKYVEWGWHFTDFGRAKYNNNGEIEFVPIQFSMRLGKARKDAPDLEPRLEKSFSENQWAADAVVTAFKEQTK